MNGRDGLIEFYLQAGLGGLFGLRSTLRCGLDGCSSRSTSCGSGIRNDLAVVLKLVLAINHDHITRVETGADTDIVASGLGDRNHPNLHGVAARDNVDIRALRSALNRCGGNNDDIVLGVDEHMDVDELIREENVVVVRENGFELVRTRRRIDLVVDGGEFAVGNFGGVVAIVGLHGEHASATDFDNHLLKLILRQGEDDGNRLQLGDDEKSSGISGVHDVSDIHETQSYAAADRRRDAGIH